MDNKRAHQLNQAIRLLSLRHRARATTLLAQLGLFPGQEALLLELDRTGPMIQARLSSALGCEPPSVTVMIRKLEAAGYLDRCPSPTDRRASVVALSTAGRAVTERVKALWCTLAEETTAGLSDAEIDAATAVVRRLEANLGSSPIASSA